MELNKKNEIINKELIIENNILIENLQKKREEVQNLKKENEYLRRKLDQIIYSRSYKAVQKIKKIIKRG